MGRSRGAAAGHPRAARGTARGHRPVEAARDVVERCRAGAGHERRSAESGGASRHGQSATGARPHEAEAVSTIDTQRLIERLAGEAEPVAPLPAPWIRTAFWLALTVGDLAVFV